jgi:hypothetical protein
MYEMNNSSKVSKEWGNKKGVLGHSSVISSFKGLGFIVY